MLADCHESLLQRVVNRCDASDLFLLRQVCKRFRDAVAQRVRRVTPTSVPSNLALGFPRLTSLDLAKLQSQDSSWLAPALAQLPDLRALLGVDISRRAIPAQTLQGLTRLALTRVRAGGQLRSLAAKCSSLVVLALKGDWSLKFADLRSVVAQLAGTLTHLELDLQQLDVPEDGLQALNIRRLQRLRLSVRRLPADVCQQLAAFSGLVSLDLSRNGDVSNDGLRHLNKLTRLTSLSLRESAVSAVGVAQLTALTNLAALDLRMIGSYTPFIQRMAEVAHGLPSALACFPGLTDLDITGCESDNPSSALRSLTKLTRLVAKCTELPQQPLPHLPLLKVLELQESFESEAQLRHLSGLSSLTRLGLAHAHGPMHAHAPMSLSSDSLRWLAGLTSLQHLCLAGWAFAQSGLEQLAQLQALRALELGKAKLSPECDLSLLERLRLERLCLPKALEADSQLLLGLQMPVMKGRRWDDEQWGALDY